MLDTQDRRAKIVDMLWDLALRRVEGPDSQGELIDPDTVWKLFKEQLADVGLVLSVVAADGSEELVPASVLQDLVATATHGRAG